MDILWSFDPPAGLESPLSQSQIFVPGTDVYYDSNPSFGVQVRLLAGITT